MRLFETGNLLFPVDFSIELLTKIAEELGLTEAVSPASISAKEVEEDGEVTEITEEVEVTMKLLEAAEVAMLDVDNPPAADSEAAAVLRERLLLAAGSNEAYSRSNIAEDDRWW